MIAAIYAHIPTRRRREKVAKYLGTGREAPEGWRRGVYPVDAAARAVPEGQLMIAAI